MNCKTARLVWNHPGGVVLGIRRHLPGVIEHLTTQVQRYVDKTPDPFDSAVKAVAGDGDYRLEHSDGDDPLAIATHDVLGDKVARRSLEEYFSQMFGRQIAFANVCCSSHNTSNGQLSPEQELAIQLTAVNIDPQTL